MSRGALRLDEAALQQLAARTRGVAASVGGPAPAPSQATADGLHPPHLLASKPAAAARAPALPKMSEDDLQISCFQWIELMRPAHPILEWIIHVPNGGKRPRGAAGKLKAMGVKPGVLDVLLPLPFNGWSGLAIEMKVGSNKTTEQQGDWLQVFEASGYYTAVCYTLEEFMGHVKCFLGSNSPVTGDQTALRQAAFFKKRQESVRQAARD